MLYNLVDTTVALRGTARSSSQIFMSPQSCHLPRALQLPRAGVGCCSWEGMWPPSLTIPQGLYTFDFFPCPCAGHHREPKLLQMDWLLPGFSGDFFCGL